MYYKGCNKLKFAIRVVLRLINKIGSTKFISPLYGDVAYVNSKGPCHRCVGHRVIDDFFYDPNAVRNGNHVVELNNLEYLELIEKRGIEK